MRAGVRAGDQAGQERAFERQVGGVVVEEHAARRRRRVSGTPIDSVNDQPIGPAAPLEDQDVAEPPVTAPASSPAAPSTASLTTSVVSRNCSAERNCAVPGSTLHLAVESASARVRESVRIWALGLSRGSGLIRTWRLGV